MEVPGNWIASQAPGPDYLSRDGRLGIEVKQRSHGLRDLRASLMQLAIWLTGQPGDRAGILLISLPRATPERIRSAWREALGALKPALAKRLTLIAQAGGQTVVEPIKPENEALARELGSLFDAERATHEKTAPKDNVAALSMSFEVTKVLLHAWLLHHPPLRIGEVMARAGVSHPTVHSVLAELARRNEIERTSDRRVELRTFPRKTLSSFVVLGDKLRQTRWIADRSGRPPDPERLLKRLEKAKPAPAAIGGVVAARRYDPRFDLNGTPRLDISWWAPRNKPYDPVSLTKVDPGLTLLTTEPPEALAVVHRIARPGPFFDRNPRGLPWADPVEVLLDLYELQLDAQAQDFVVRMRGSQP